MRSPVLTVPSDASVEAAVARMHTHRVSSLVVTPRYAGDAFGIITKHDVLAKVVAHDREPRKVAVAKVMSTPLVAVEPECTARECATLMLKHRIRRLVVVVAGEPVGMVSNLDVFDALLNFRTEAAMSASV